MKVIPNNRVPITNPKLNGLKSHKFDRNREKKAVKPTIKNISPDKVYSLSLEVTVIKDIGVKDIILIFLTVLHRKAYQVAPRRRYIRKKIFKYRGKVPVFAPDTNKTIGIIEASKQFLKFC